jgi:hypothetical protein
MTDFELVQNLFKIVFEPIQSQSHFDEVENVFCLLCEEKPRYPHIEFFADYVLETYIETNVFPTVL